MITESSNWIVNSDRTDLRLIRAEAVELCENRDLIRKKILLKKQPSLYQKALEFRRKENRR